MKPPFRVMLVSVAITVAASLAPSSAHAASDRLSDPPSPPAASFSHMTSEQVLARKMAVTHDEIMALVGASEPSGATASAVGAAGVCAFASDGDYVHTSTYSGVLYASGHGYWWNFTCPSSYRANVTIWLEEKLGTDWYPQGDPVTGYNRAPGSGSTQRVNAKMACVNTTSHQWRSLVVADIVGHSDTAPAAYTAARTLACY